ncbi:MAG: IclR family transcriptional regulator [Deltaproteobacteria bacterium]|nr:IclR family transcriptional regulator [Deltaproteobacteria bacterium]
MLIKSLEKALRILLSFKSQRKSQTLLDISKHTSIPLTSLYRFLGTLEKHGFVKAGAGGKSYQLGPALFRLGMFSYDSVDLREVAKPEMEKVAELTGESVFLTVRDGRSSVCIESAEGKHRVRLTQRIGAVLPLHAGAAARILLAYMPEAERQNMLKTLELRALGPGTITRRPVLEKKIRAIPSRGFDVSKEEVDTGSCGVAVPVFSEKGEVIAALASGGPIYRFTDKNIKQIVYRLSKASHMIGKNLGLARERAISQ